MKKLTLACVMCLFALTAFGQRTFVSGTGSDLNPCSVSQPCRTLQQAINAVSAGGEVVVLDSAGYGTGVSINKSVNILSPDGIYGVIQDGVTVNAGASDIIRIRGLDVLGSTTVSGTGVNVQLCKRTELEKMRISHINIGVRVSNDVHVIMNNLTIADTVTGIYSIGSNTAAGPGQTSPPLKVLVQNTKIYGAQVGVNVVSGSFWMGQDSTITNCTTDSYLIAAGVTNCSSISVGGNGIYNNFTGQYNAICMCNTQDLRNGMNNLGNCNAQ